MMAADDDEITNTSGISNETRKKIVAVVEVVLALYFGGCLGGATVAPIAYLWDRGVTLPN
jgi:hypothetical protein